MQIHQDPMFDHAVAHAEAEIILSTTRSGLATIQHIQANWELTPPDPGHKGLPSESCNKELPDDHKRPNSHML